MRFILKLVLASVLLTSPVFAEKRLIVRSQAGELVLNTTCMLLGCTVDGGLGDPLSQLFLVTVPDTLNLNDLITALSNTLGIVGIEIDHKVQLADDRRPIPQDLYDTQLKSFFGKDVRRGYADQPATRIIRTEEAQSTFSLAGLGIVAVIDTGVDPNHPVLRPVLLPGYDYTRGGRASASEMGDVTQSTAAVVDGVPPTHVSDNAAAVLDQSTAAVVDDPDHAAFGHGTMVAGIIHLVAPNARILPLKAFGPNGSGYTSDILRAVYRAVKENANVINMSFSMTSPSPELKRAIVHASSKGAICVASAGNQGQAMSVYPAAWANVIGVASTTNDDQRSNFSNYGSTLVTLAAPGEGVITTYPFGTYAAAWGTSFSTPLVSGTVALLRDARPTLTASEAVSALGQAVPLGPELGRGRLDTLRAVELTTTMH